jgi:hypothetical protein
MYWFYSYISTFYYSMDYGYFYCTFPQKEEGTIIIIGER